MILEQFGADDPGFLVSLIRDSDLRQYKVLMPLLRPYAERVLDPLTAELDRQPPAGASDQVKNEIASQQANCAVALLLLGRPHAVWSLLKDSPEPRVRGFLIDRIEPLGVNPAMFFDRVREERDVSIRRALLLVLADYRGKGLSAADVESLKNLLLETFRTDPDPGVHAAAELGLRRSGHGNEVDALALRLMSTQRHLGERWYVNKERYTMVVIDPRGKDPCSQAASPSLVYSRWRQRRFRSSSFFVIAKIWTTTPSTVRPRAALSTVCAGTTQLSIAGGSASKKAWQKIKCVIPRSRKSKKACACLGTILTRTGYRLPTEAEFEYACRAGALTTRFFGSADELLPAYAYFRGSSRDRSWPVGSLRPNDFGLFDILGNLLEWCQESRGPEGIKIHVDVEDTTPVSNSIERVLRGGSYDKVINHVESSRSEHALPPVEWNTIGFRVVRTHALAR